MFDILVIADGLIVGGFIFLLIGSLFGDKPLVRLLKLLLGIFAGVGYLMLCVAINTSDINMFIGCIILFGPVALMVILCLVYYMFKDK